MDTVVLREDMARAAALLREGALVAVPTETVYGLAGNGLDARAVREIYEVKGRPEQKPLSLMVPGPEAIPLYCEDVPGAATALAERFWPGPLTLVLNAKMAVPDIVRAGGETVGLRCPDHPLTLELLRLAEIPLAAPSANPSGAPSPVSAEEVLAYFEGKIAAVIDGGRCGLGRESTVLDMSRTPYRVLREGALSRESIVRALRERMLCIGITGGSGSGKTTALEVLEERGARVIDCDALYHRLLESDGELLAEIDSRFPGTVRDGALDRKALGAIVFSDPEALAALNRITHRYILRALEDSIDAWAMAGGELVAIDAVELIGSGLGDRCTVTIGVIAEEERRIERIMAREGISREYALLRVRAQKPDAYFKENCDYVLENNGDMESFVIQCKKMMEEICEHG